VTRRRFQLFTAITELVCRHATGVGLLLILEDMHWADRTSVRLLRHLVAVEPADCQRLHDPGFPLELAAELSDCW
jgi:predicted ATPase